MMSRWGGIIPPPVIRRVAEVKDESIHLPEASPWTTDEPAWAHLLRANHQRQPQKSVIPREVLRPLDADDFVWPSMAEILAAQAMTAEKPPGKAKHNPNNEIWVGARLWIPRDATCLIQRMLVIAHCGSMGHRGEDVMYSHIRRQFWIDNLKQLVQNFVRECSMCPLVKGERVIQRPHSELWHAERANEGLHFDFLFMGDSFGPMKYILVLKDDLTHFCELIACEAPTADVVVTALLDWHKRFGIPETWISDQ
ncbi:Aste57867_24725 [Aphanomyces stellatus]|uniref:Aste57867_24725 protein n=1 Tax=Aphanomyces stellatus TaxID=120398 RepID=A0A485LRV4_9STRA|nr:hypothetical protein As57867_024647 [Aphanomyces stellatus]VFU01362.1 Aste57867_24725 [Aphanomyces stellatus]